MTVLIKYWRQIHQMLEQQITVSDFKSWLLKTKDIRKEHLKNDRCITLKIHSFVKE